MVSFMAWLLYWQGKTHWYPLDTRLGGPKSHSGHGGKEKKSLPFLGSCRINNVGNFTSMCPIAPLWHGAKHKHGFILDKRTELFHSGSNIKPSMFPINCVLV
jgi:hypothetical protein